MIEPGDPKTESARRRRRALLGAAAFVVIVAGFVGLALFQPWKLWVDDTVNKAAPAGAVAVTAPAPPEPVGGDFAGIDHGMTGRVVVLQDAAGTQFVRLENLDTSNGPDLFVYLSGTSVAPTTWSPLAPTSPVTPAS